MVIIDFNEREVVAMNPKPEGTGAGTPSSRVHRHLAHLDPLISSPIVFMTVTTYGRRSILACREAQGILEALGKRSDVVDGWFVGDYLLMPDHVHFFVRAAFESKPLGAWVQMWKSVSAREFRKSFGVSAPVWQPDYFDRYLRNSESYSEKWVYVEQNPMRAGLVEKGDNWPFKGRIHELRF